MRILFALAVLVVLLVPTPSFAAFSWEHLGGDPRSSVPLESTQDIQRWILSPEGQTDLVRVGLSAQRREEATVAVRNGNMAQAFLRPGNQISFDGGATWQPARINNLTFGRQGTVFDGPVMVNWRNYSRARAYYPAGMTGWVPAVIGRCGNMVLIWVPRPPPPITYIPPPVQPPPILAPPPPIIPPIPTTGPHAYHAPGMPTEQRSQTTLAVLVPVPEAPKINNNVSATSSSASASSSSSASNTGPITITNVNQNNNQNVIPISINGGTATGTATNNQVGP